MDDIGGDMDSLRPQSVLLNGWNEHHIKLSLFVTDYLQFINRALMRVHLVVFQFLPSLEQS